MVPPGPGDFKVYDPWFKAKPYNTMEEKKFVSEDRVAKIKKKQTNVLQPRYLGWSAWFWNPRQHSVYFSVGLALQKWKSTLFLCVSLCMLKIKIKATTSFGRNLMHSPKEKFVLLQKLGQLTKRFQKALPTLTRSRNFDNLWWNGKTSGWPHFRVRKIKLILSFINTDILAMACLHHIEEIPKQCILGL